MPKKKKSMAVPVSQETVEKRIYLIRDKRVMLDRDLAELYKVTTKALNQAVKRNLDRFPEDFMFRLTKEETDNLRSQIVTFNSKANMSLRYRPWVFTESGVAMLSSVLNSHEAIQVNIQIIRAFIRMRQTQIAHMDLWLKIDAMEKKYDGQFQVVFKAIKLLLDERPPADEPKDRRFDV